MTKETEAVWNSTMLDALLRNEVLRTIAYVKNPLSQKELNKVRKSVIDSIDIAAKDPGSVIKIECRDQTKKLLKKTKAKNELLHF